MTRVAFVAGETPEVCTCGLCDCWYPAQVGLVCFDCASGRHHPLDFDPEVAA